MSLLGPGFIPPAAAAIDAARAVASTPRSGKDPHGHNKPEVDKVGGHKHSGSTDAAVRGKDGYEHQDQSPGKQPRRQPGLNTHRPEKPSLDMNA